MEASADTAFAVEYGDRFIHEPAYRPRWDINLPEVTIADRPALLLRDRGEDRDPWRGPGRPRGTLQGPPAARVVRALIDFAPPYTIPDLAERARASTGATYRVIELLEQERLLERQRYGPITDVRWRALLSMRRDSATSCQ